MEILREKLENKIFEDSEELDGELYNVRDESELSTGEFFQTSYQALLCRDSGPRLSTLIMSVGQEESAEILDRII